MSETPAKTRTALAYGGALLTVLIAACIDPLTTSAVYLFVTPFHGYLELVVLACWAAERRGSRSEQLLQA